MPDRSHLQMLWLIVLIVLVSIVGLIVILGILRSWRNYNMRQRLIDEGKALRTSAPGARPAAGYVDTWREAGQRYTDEADDDAPASQDKTDPPREPDEDEAPDESDDDDQPPFPRR